MIQILLTLIGLLFPASNAQKSNNAQDITIIQSVSPADSDTGEDTIPVLPPKK